MTQIEHVRLLIADPTGPNRIHSDQDITQYLADAGGIDYVAASFALEAEASSASRMTKRITIGNFGTDESQVYQSLMARAKELRAQAPIPPIVNSLPFSPSLTHINTDMW